MGITRTIASFILLIVILGSSVPYNSSPPQTANAAGTSVTVTGSNFLASTAIVIRYDGNIVPTTPSTTTSTSAGGFSTSINIPSSAVGGHTVSASDGTRTATSTFTVSNTSGYPITHMQDTTVSFASLLSSSRQIVGEYVTPTSQLVGDKR